MGGALLPPEDTPATAKKRFTNHQCHMCEYVQQGEEPRAQQPHLDDLSPEGQRVRRRLVQKKKETW